MSTNNALQIAYGFSQPLINVLDSIQSNRAPSVNDKAPITTIWVNKLTNNAYILTSVVNNLANWESLGAAGSATTFNTDAGTAIPASGVINVVGGTNTNTVGGGNTITVNSTGAPAITWQTVTTDTSLVSNNGYFLNGADTLTLTLPLTANVGDIILIRVLNTSVNGWIIAQNANQFVIANSEPGQIATFSTIGVTGNVNGFGSNQWYSSIDLVCSTTNNVFVANNYNEGLDFN